MRASELNFDGKVVLITGAANGIGRCTSLRLAELGARQYALDIDAAGLTRTEREVKERGADFEGCVMDVADAGRCAAAAAACVERFGRLDVLLNIAGIITFSHSHETQTQDWERQLAVNLSGPFFLCQAAIPHLLTTGGNVVNVASNAGVQGQAYTAAYCASKGGLVNLTRALAMEYMKQNIRINALLPWGVNTGMADGQPFPEAADPELMQRYSGMRGLTEPEEIAEAILYLASDAARFVHGATWGVDNGVLAG